MEERGVPPSLVDFETGVEESLSLLLHVKMGSGGGGGVVSFKAATRHSARKHTNRGCTFILIFCANASHTGSIPPR